MPKNLIDNNIYLSIKEVAHYTGTSVRTLKDKCKKNKYSCRIVPSIGGNRGQKYEILVSSLETELQQKIYTNLDFINGGKSPVYCVKQPSPLSFNLSSNSSNIRRKYNFSDTNLNDSGNIVPEDAKRNALAKFNVLELWNNYRNNKTDKKKADEEFLLAYNNGLIAAEYYEMTGKVSRATLYRWQKLLNEANNDYHALINNYKYSGELVLNNSLTDFEKQEFIKLYYNDAKLNLSVAYSLLKFKLSKQGIETKSEATYRRFVKYINKYHYDFAVLSREGEKALNDKVGMYLHRDISDIKVGDALVADGNKLDFTVINPFTGHPVRAILVVFLDWCSFDVAGYEIMLSENTQCISSALRSSILRLGKIPKYVYIDNGKAFRSSYFTKTKSFDDCNFKGIYANLGINTIIANAYSGRSKVVERFFRNFVQSCPPCLPSYIGNCIENRPAHLRRNEKFHKELHKNDKIPTIEEAKSIIELWLEYYRTKKCPHSEQSVGEVFNEGKGDGINPQMLDELMMASNIRVVKRSVIRILGLEYSSAKLWGISGKVLVKYSLFDLSQVKAYTLKGEFICDVPLITKVKAIVKEGSALDIYNYKMQLKQQKALISQTKQKTKLLMGVNNPFNDVEWTHPDVIPIDSKKEKTKLEITLYEDFHKLPQRKIEY